jgi:hypothetical protein
VKVRRLSEQAGFRPMKEILGVSVARVSRQLYSLTKTFKIRKTEMRYGSA